MLTKRRYSTDIDNTRYGVNPDIVRIFELQFEKHVLTPGDRFKVKNSHGVFIFRNLAHNVKSDITWVDAMDEKTGEFRSFYVSKIKSLVRKVSHQKNERSRTTQ